MLVIKVEGRADTINVILRDIRPGAGQLIMESGDDAWAYTWGAIGSSTLAEFLIKADISYLTMKLARSTTSDREAHFLEPAIKSMQEVLRGLAALPKGVPDEIVTIRIPVSKPLTNRQRANVVMAISDALEDSLSEVTNDNKMTTLADDLGFGGNTLTIELDAECVELCL